MYKNSIKTRVQKETRTRMFVMHLFDSKTLDLVVSYLLGVTVNYYENVTCKGNIFLIL